MAAGHVSNTTGYAGVTLNLARRAIGVAFDAAPHRAREGERRWPMAEALPAARVLIGGADDADPRTLEGSTHSLAQTLADPAGKVTDGFGHTRPVYAYLAVHLLGTAARLVRDDGVLSHARQAAEALLQNVQASRDSDPRLGAWRRLVARQHGIREAEALPLPCDIPAPLHPLGLDDLLDAWTYRELVGLHAMQACALLEHSDALAARVHQARLYHLGHTQPDYTTYQPWALAAFASDPHTAVFAEQQLHDVATHLSIEGPGGAVLPALLLADAAATMSGRSVVAWISR